MADAGAVEKLKVFISYSRKDSAEFADELLAGLEYGGFAPFLDRHDIAAGSFVHLLGGEQRPDRHASPHDPSSRHERVPSAQAFTREQGSPDIARTSHLLS